MTSDPMLMMALGMSFLGCVVSLVAGGLFLRAQDIRKSKVMALHRHRTAETCASLPEKLEKQTNVFYGGGVFVRGSAAGYAVVSRVTAKDKGAVIYAASQDLVASAWKNRAFVVHDSGGFFHTSVVSS